MKEIKITDIEGIKIGNAENKYINNRFSKMSEGFNSFRHFLFCKN